MQVLTYIPRSGGRITVKVVIDGLNGGEEEVANALSRLSAAYFWPAVVNNLFTRRVGRWSHDGNGNGYAVTITRDQLVNGGTGLTTKKVVDPDRVNKIVNQLEEMIGDEEVKAGNGKAGGKKAK